MSPPSSTPLAAENEYWTDEQIFMSLLNFKSGKSLPSNVESEVNPFHYRPQDLPEDLWYFCSVVKNESELGFWVETGDPCEIICNSIICGFRTTLRFYEGKSPDARKTDWVMQQYKINVKDDDRALCRVFLAVESSLEEMECILTGDYFELNDLIDDHHGSCSSSSLNSSCLTMSSDEYFDSIALLQQLDDDDDEKMKNSSINLNISAPVNSKLVIFPTTTVSLRNETCEAKEEDRNKSTSNSAVMNTGTESSSRSEGMFKKEKKENVSKTKRRKMMKYLCFMAF